jgi:hypothetical protein
VLAGVVVLAVGVLCVGLSRRGPEHAALMAQVLAVGGAAAYVIAKTPRRIAAALAALVVVTVVVDGRSGLAESRTFFGVYRVSVDDDGRHVFEHGTTIHGEQEFAAGPTTEPLTYYAGFRWGGPSRRSPTTRSARCRGGGPRGRHVGGIRAARRPHRLLRDRREVVRIARDPRLFTFLRDTRATVSTVVGDERLELARSSGPLISWCSAFSSDAIPVPPDRRGHGRVSPAPRPRQGDRCAHLERFFDLAPIVSRLGERAGLQAPPQHVGVDVMLLSDDRAPAALQDELADPAWRLVEPTGRRRCGPTTSRTCSRRWSRTTSDSRRNGTRLATFCP